MIQNESVFAQALKGNVTIDKALVYECHPVQPLNYSCQLLIKQKKYERKKRKRSSQLKC